MLGYLKWLIRQAVREPLAWAAMLMILGLVAAASGCPGPWPMYIASLGALIILVYSLRLMVQVSYDRYQREQQDLIDQLRRK